MKTGNITTIGWLLLCSATLLFSCDRDDKKDVPNHYLLTVKAVDQDLENIKDNVSLYFFNGEQKLEKTVQCQLDTEIDIEGSVKKPYSVVALGHSADMTFPVITPGTSIEDAKIILETSIFANNTIAKSPGDIFYGRLELTGDCEDAKEIIWIRRKVAALSISTRNIQSALNTTDEDFSYIVRETSGTMDFNGNLKGDKVNYRPASGFNVNNKNLVAPMFYTYAKQDEDSFCIDIYKGTVLIKTFCTDSSENPMLLKEGKHTAVLIDFGSNVGGNGVMNVSCVLKDWVDDNINEGFN